MPINYKDYPANWKTEIRPAILARDENKCMFCGVENSRLIHRYGPLIYQWKYWPEGMESEAWTLDGLKATKIVLTIAHLDQDKTNNDYDNLAALCQKCHLGHDLKHHMENARATREKNKQLQRLF